MSAVLANSRWRQLILAAPLLLPALVAYVTLFVVPIVYLAMQSFRMRQSALSSELTGLTFGNYVRLLTDPFYLGMLFGTFRLAFITSAICLVLAYPMAYFLRLCPDRYKGLILLGVLAPLLVSVVVRTFGWVVVLGEYGLVNSLLQGVGYPGDFAKRTHLYNEAAVVIGLVHVFFPFMVMALYNALQKLDMSLIRAARNLGATPLRAFREVTFPLTLPGVASGCTTVFALTTGAYVTVAVLGGPRVLVLAILAYQESVGLMNWQFGAAVGATLLVTTTAILALFQFAISRFDKQAAAA